MHSIGQSLLVRVRRNVDSLAIEQRILCIWPCLDTRNCWFQGLSRNQHEQPQRPSARERSAGYPQSLTLLQIGPAEPHARLPRPFNPQGSGCLDPLRREPSWWIERVRPGGRTPATVSRVTRGERRKTSTASFLEQALERGTSEAHSEPRESSRSRAFSSSFRSAPPVRTAAGTGAEKV